MLSLAPMSDKTEIAKIFAEKGIAYNDSCGCVTALCKNELLGLCLYETNREKMTVLYLEPLNDIALADGILRSTLHVAAERGIMNTFYAETLPEDFLDKIGFIKEKSEKRLDIDKLFKSCCGCGN